MEFYSHQQQQQSSSTTTTTSQPQQQLVDLPMATIAAAASSTTTNNNNNNIATSHSINNNNNNIISSSSTPPTVSSSSSSGYTTAPDAATVAIAKDMLQLHHSGGLGGGGVLINNNNNNNNTNVDTIAGGSSSSTSPVALTTTTQTSTPPASCTSPPENALGFLKFEQDLLYISEPCTIIGRNSSTSHVHFHVAENNLVSRKHFQVLFDPERRNFYVQCLSKNGIFVDDFLQRRNADPLKLPTSCYFRFPSTEIRIQFESFMQGSPGVSVHGNNVATLLHQHHSSSAAQNNHHATLTAGGIVGGVGFGGHHATGIGNAHVIISPVPPEDLHHPHHSQSSSSLGGGGNAGLASSSTGAGSHLMPMDSSNVIYSPLKISIPKKEQKSPYLSPTGTISAANSCPASPRQGFHQNQANYNNYGNNNLQNQDLFQTPSTASYNHNEKPPYSYAQLIVQAISAAPDKQLTLSGIYSFIVKHYPYYRKETNKGWQNSIRHNLSLNRYFIKVARSQDEPGKGSFWRIDPDSGAKLIDHSYKKRRQRSSQGFRPSYGMPRSAPVSPSHMEYFADNSRESSPLQDIVLQSAPGSPGMSLENRATEGDLMYNSQNMHQTAANNSHNPYSSGSPYYISNQNSTIGQQQQQQHQQPQGGHIETGGGNSVGALIALKRNHAMAAGAAMGGGHQQQQQQQQQQPIPLHPDIIYEELPTDYSGNVESGDECGGSIPDAANAAKRPKYISEAL